MKSYIRILISSAIFFLIACNSESPSSANKDDNLPEISGFPVVSTNQKKFYDNSNEISAPTSGDEFYGQDALYLRNEASYEDNGDGTVTDMVSGLMWAKSPDMDGDGDIDINDKMTYAEATSGLESFALAGHVDWRLPSIKELYSLIQFSGVDPSGFEGTSTDGLVPFINTDYFDFAYGDIDAGNVSLILNTPVPICMLMDNCYLG